MSSRITRDARVKVCCGQPSTVLNSRDVFTDSVEVPGIRRRRLCEICEARWTTIEVSSYFLLQAAEDREAELNAQVQEIVRIAAEMVAFKKAAMAKEEGK